VKSTSDKVESTKIIEELNASGKARSLSDKFIFSDDYKDSAYWWDINPPPAIPTKPLPKITDVVIIGSGYTIYT